ncbi:MAG: alpha/beta hydrolase [Anaerolineales bacterium]|nr:alpha/beta hydrolase [Anaerolineales bacterium]
MVDVLETRYFELEDARIACCEHGEGPDLLLLHGNSQSKHIFRSYQLEHFASFHTIAIDSRCHGESTCGNGELCLERCCDDVVCLCQWLGIAKTSVIGYSDGGNIALLLAKKAPHLLQKMIAISPNYRVDGMTTGTIRMIRLGEGILTRLAPLGLKAGKAAQRMAMMLRDLEISEDDLRALCADIQILHAEKDAIREEHLHRLAALIPGAVIRKIPGCTHLSILKQQPCIDCMRQFLLA